ncbi:hypothetical protein M8J76_011429 [Diaphorina citri]|nr:hypothetical protein M8J76_011429 [Diaphorina citri]
MIPRYEESASSFQREQATYPDTMIKILTLYCLLLVLISDSQGRNRKSPYMPPIPIGSFGRICPNEEKDTQSCAKAMAALADYYKVSFNLMACEKNHHESFHRQCHVRFKPSKTTDFECWVTNAPDGSGRAMAKCRAPWRKDLQANQIRTGYGGGQAQAGNAINRQQGLYGPQQGYGSQQGMYGSPQGMYGAPQGGYGASQGGYGGYGGYGGNPYQGQG